MRPLLVLLLLVVVGCSHAPKVRAIPTGLKPAQFWLDQQKRLAEVKQIMGKLRLRYQAKNQSLGGQGRVLGQLPNQARLELRDPLGRTAFLATLEGKDFLAFYPTQKKAYVGEDSGAAFLKQFMGMEASFAELQRMMLGLLPTVAPRNNFDRWEWDAEKGQYRGDLKAKQQTLTVFVDPDYSVLRELHWEAPAQTIHVTYSDFESCCGAIGKMGESTNVPVAQTIKLRMEKVDTSIEIQWDEVVKLEQTRGRDAFQVVLPEEVQKIALP